jgi:heme/copper-type cytochrome/quinol oxidase subunit 4
VIRPQRIVLIRSRKSKRTAAIPAASLFSTTMKKFIAFILVLSLLIVAEYYFLTEFFSQKRVSVIVVCLLVIVACLYGLTRFFKRSYFSS